MKIGIVTAWFESGAGYVSKLYANTLSSQHNVYIYARGGDYASADLASAKRDPAWNLPNVTWAKKGIPFVATAIDLKDFQRWLERHKIEVVIFNEQWYWPPVVLCNQLGIKTGTYVDYYNEDTVPLFDAYDFLLCNTRRHYSAFEWHPQCLYIPWGTDLNLFKPKSTDILQNGSVTFFHSSYYSPERKGTDLVINAFSKLPLNTFLVVHTKGDLGTVYPSLKETIDGLLVSGRLTIIKDTVSAPGLYHLGDVYVYPSRLEGIGLTIAEAMACGLPVITSNNPPMNEFVEHGKNGRLVAIDRLVARSDGYYWPQCYPNVDSLYEQMKYYVDNLTEIKMNKDQTRRWTEKHLNWDRNSVFLSERIAKIEKRSGAALWMAGRKALEYERSKAPIYQRFPRAYALLRTGHRIVKGIKGAL